MPMLPQPRYRQPRRRCPMPRCCLTHASKLMLMHGPMHVACCQDSRVRLQHDRKACLWTAVLPGLDVGRELLMGPAGVTEIYNLAAQVQQPICQGFQWHCRLTIVLQQHLAAATPAVSRQLQCDGTQRLTCWLHAPSESAMQDCQVAHAGDETLHQALDRQLLRHRASVYKIVAPHKGGVCTPALQEPWFSAHPSSSSADCSMSTGCAAGAELCFWPTDSQALSSPCVMSVLAPCESSRDTDMLSAAALAARFFCLRFIFFFWFFVSPLRTALSLGVSARPVCRSSACHQHASSKRHTGRWHEHVRNGHMHLEHALHA